MTATRTGAERFATLFGGYFVDALAGTDADSDRNRRISVLKAFTYAKREVATAYEREGIMSTEHALLSDSGGEGIPNPSADGKQGKVAAVLSLGSVASTDPLPADPKLRALYLERRDLERRIEALKLLKGSMPAERYAGELEEDGDGPGAQDASAPGAGKEVMRRAAVLALVLAVAGVAVLAADYAAGTQREERPASHRSIRAVLRRGKHFRGTSSTTGGWCSCAFVTTRGSVVADSSRAGAGASRRGRTITRPPTRT